MSNALLQTLAQQKPLQIGGTINAYTALLAEQAGFQAIYLSGAGVANACYGLPDLGVTRLQDVVMEVQRLRQASHLPLLVDGDTGWENIHDSVRSLEHAGADAVHFEDQVSAKRCGHLEGKQLVTTAEMVHRIEQACAAKKNILIMARTDAHAIEGLNGAIERAQAYVAAGAQMIFAEALTSLEEISDFVRAVKVPILVNMTEFGKTPLFTVKEINTTGAAMILYPLSAFRMMNEAARHCYETILQQGSQASLISQMQSRDDLYEVLQYHYWENHREELLKRLKEK